MEQTKSIVSRNQTTMSTEVQHYDAPSIVPVTECEDATDRAMLDAMAIPLPPPVMTLQTCTEPKLSTNFGCGPSSPQSPISPDSMNETNFGTAADLQFNAQRVLRCDQANRRWNGRHSEIHKRRSIKDIMMNMDTVGSFGATPGTPREWNNECEKQNGDDDTETSDDFSVLTMSGLMPPFPPALPLYGCAIWSLAVNRTFHSQDTKHPDTPYYVRRSHQVLGCRWFPFWRSSCVQVRKQEYNWQLASRIDPYLQTLTFDDFSIIVLHPECQAVFTKQCCVCLSKEQ